MADRGAARIPLGARPVRSALASSAARRPAAARYGPPARLIHLPRGLRRARARDQRALYAPSSAGGHDPGAPSVLSGIPRRRAVGPQARGGAPAAPNAAG